MNYDFALLDPDEVIVFTAEGPVVVKNEPKPEVCPECWNETPVDGERAMAAVRAMSKGGLW